LFCSRELLEVWAKDELVAGRGKKKVGKGKKQTRTWEGGLQGKKKRRANCITWEKASFKGGKTFPAFTGEEGEKNGRKTLQGAGRRGCASSEKKKEGPKKRLLTTRGASGSLSSGEDDS